jgi:hypothetical protein
MSKLELCVVRQYVNQNDSINSLRDNPAQIKSVNVINKYIQVYMITITKENIPSVTDVFLNKIDITCPRQLDMSDVVTCVSLSILSQVLFHRDRTTSGFLFKSVNVHKRVKAAFCISFASLLCK